MPVNVQVNTSSEQDAKLDALLIVMNEQRVAQNEEPYADVDAMSRGALIEQLKGWYAMADHDEVKMFTRTFEGANRATRDAVIAILAPQP